MRCQNCNELLPLSSKACFDCGIPVDPPSAATIQPPASPRLRLRVAELTTTLRDRPFAAARPVTTLRAGEWVAVLAEQAGFMHVETTDGQRGYVHATAVEGGVQAGAAPIGRAATYAVPPHHATLRPAVAPALAAPANGTASDPAPTADVLVAPAGTLRRPLRTTGHGGVSVIRWMSALMDRPGRVYAVAAALLVAAAAITVISAARHGASEREAAAGAGGTAAGPSAGRAAAEARSPSPVVAFPPGGAEVASPARIEVKLDGVALKSPSVGDPYASHLHYFIDTDPAAVVGPGQPVPVGIPGIYHTDATHLTVDLSPGPHTVWVVLTDNDHVTLSPPAQTRVSFTITSTPRPAEQAPLVYQSLVDGRWRLFVVEVDGAAPRALAGAAWDDIDPAWSPDGARVAFASNRDGRFHLYVMDADGSNVRQLTRGDFRDRTPAWSPDGNWLAFSSDREGGIDQLFVLNARAASTSGQVVEAKQLTSGTGGGSQPVWSPDSSRLVFVRQAGEVTQLFVVNATGGELRQLTSAYQRHIDPAWSPDGRRIAYTAVRDNRSAVFVMTVDGTDEHRVTGGDFDRHPAWSPDGRQLAWASGREGQQQIFAVDEDSGTIRRLTDGAYHSMSPAWPRR